MRKSSEKCVQQTLDPANDGDTHESPSRITPHIEAKRSYTVVSEVRQQYGYLINITPLLRDEDGVAKIIQNSKSVFHFTPIISEILSNRPTEAPFEDTIHIKRSESLGGLMVTSYITLPLQFPFTSCITLPLQFPSSLILRPPFPLSPSVNRTIYLHLLNI